MLKETSKKKILKVSIVTAVRNGAGTIAKTLESVNSQTYDDIEHIIIDGCSSDKTLFVVNKYKGNKTIIVSEPDLGVYDAMNKGARLSNGDIICFLNADDYYITSKSIEKVVQRFTEDTFDVVYGDIEYVTSGTREVVSRKWKSGPFKKGLFSLGWAPPHPAFFTKMCAFNNAGGFRLEYRLAADADLMMRILEVQSKKSSYIPQVMVRMRLGGATNKSLRNILRGNIEIWKSLNANGLNPRLLSFTINKFLLKTRHTLASLN